MAGTTTESFNTAAEALLFLQNVTEHDDDHEEVSVDSSNLVVAKVVAMLFLGLASFAVGMLPVKLASCMRWSVADSKTGHSLVISLLLCFGGGVLLFTTFLHLQPEVREGFVALESEGKIYDFGRDVHLAELVFCAGFFFVYLVEELVHAVLDRRPMERADEAVLHRTMSLRRCSRHPTHSAEGEAPAGNLIPRVTLSTPPPPPGAVVPATKKAEDAATNGSTGSSISASTHGLLNNSSSLSAITILDAKPSPLDAELRMTGGPLERTRPHRHHGHHHGHSHSHAVPLTEDDDDMSTSSSTVAKSFRGLLAVLALSFHAVFEGLAVGLEKSVGQVWYLFGAIATHKLVIAFCVGVELVGSRTRMPLLLVYVAAFAMVTPLGIGAGLAISGAGDGDSAHDHEGTVVTVVLQGMAAGTLLYVVFFEVLQRERANTQSGILQLAAIASGFAVMFVFQMFTGHSHNHGHSHGHHDHDLHNASELSGGHSHSHGHAHDH